MKLYAGIDLHSNNSVLVVLDENDKVIYSKRLPNDAQVILEVLAMYKEQIEAVAVESTYNWYWLVDALQDDGYTVRLVNTAAVVVYDGLKYSGDIADARHLAHLLRMNLLPCGYIYPKEPRALRDLARKRAQLVRQRTTLLLSIKNLLVRNCGQDIPSTTIKKWTSEHITDLPLLPEQRLAIQANCAVMHTLEQQIEVVEKELLRQLKPCKAFNLLKTMAGVGDILSMTIFWKPAIYRVLTVVVILLLTLAWLTQSVSPTVRKKAKGIANAETAIYAGRLWRRHILLWVQMNLSDVFISVSALRA